MAAPSARLIPPADLPPSMATFADDVARLIEGPRRNPVQHPSFANAAALPDAARWFGGTVYVEDIEMVAVSTGAAWKRLDTGATL